MLLVLAVTALVKTAPVTTPPGRLSPSFSWLVPVPSRACHAFTTGIILMVFIYWGWDTAVSVNEETKDKAKTPGRAAIISTVILLFTYVIVIFGIQSFAGIGTKGIGLANQAHAVRRAIGPRARRSSAAAGSARSCHLLLILMVLILGCCLDPDDDPADRPDHAVDGRLQGASPRPSPRSTPST